MDYPTLLLLVSFVWTIFFLLISSKSSKSSKLPPGPRPYPIIGNILELGNNPLHSITHLSKCYGPIMTLKLGTITTIVISSSELAKEVLHTYDTVFSSRIIPDSARVLDHHKVSIGWLPISAKWRTLRRACATKIFSPQQLDSTQFLRKKKVQDLLDYVHECCKKGGSFDFGEAIFTTVLNSISNTFFSMDLFHYHAPDHKSYNEFKEIIFGIVEEAGRPNIADFYPFFRLFDLQGVRARTRNHYTKLVAFIDGVMEERMRLRASESKECKDALDSLLNVIKEESSSQLSCHDVLHLFGVSISICLTHQILFPN